MWGVGIAVGICSGIAATSKARSNLPKSRTGSLREIPKLLLDQEAPVGIEPTNGGFADLCLTTWLRRRGRRSYPTESLLRKSFCREGLRLPRLH